MTLEDSGLAKVCVTYLDQGTLRILGAILPAAKLAEIMAEIEKAAVG